MHQVVTYVYAIWVGHFLDLRPADEFCTGKALADRATRWRDFPPSNKCLWRDGTTTDLVPWPAKVLLFACLATVATVIVLAARDSVLAIRDKYRRRAAETETTPETDMGDTT